jgi:hypothetical protein
MFTKTIAFRNAAITAVLASATLVSQTKTAAPVSSAGLELPVTMRQNVTAGSTPVGTRVQAKLAVATLVNGVVIPQDAVLSGAVTESVAKSATTPSRLAIRLDSAQWKNRSTPAPMVISLEPKIYLTAWYYPVAALMNPNLSTDMPETSQNPRFGTVPNAYPGGRSPTSPSMPSPSANSGAGSETRADKNTTPTSTSEVSKHRVLMKNVDSTRNSDGAVSLTSKQLNIKLDKTTTYVFSTGELASGRG